MIGDECLTLSTIEERTQGYLPSIDLCRSTVLLSSDLSFPKGVQYEKKKGKVRDIYLTSDYVIIVATDRQSAFDRNLAGVPFKGQVLNLTSNWWFNQTKHLVPNHIIATPHSNITICKKCSVFPVEFVVRGYITGSTSTSMWTNYAKGIRNYCGHILPDNLQKNQKLSHVMVTPTTKDDTHDELISAEEIIRTERMTKEEWEICSNFALTLFTYSQDIALSRGLILVDTKYEFGRDISTGEILLIDEIQTPDSSRYWLANSYEERFQQGLDPENIDKEFLRRWYVAHCDPYKDETLPDPPAELINELSRRYILLYELITNESIHYLSYDNLEERMNEMIQEFLK